MITHYPTVPVEAARQMALLHKQDRLRPVVLVVDDEPIITETLAAILNRSGLAAMTALNARSAIETAALIPPEMLITDLAMPDMDGLDLAIEVKRTVPDCDIILFSGQASDSETLAKLRTTGRGFVTLPKPVHPADLLQRVFECLGRRGSVTMPA